MHELAICRSLLDRAEQIARANHALAICSLTLAIGPLSGVESGLLLRAFDVAKHGTLAASAALRIDETDVEVRCQTCGETTNATAQRLLCGACGDWRTDLVRGAEMFLMSLELETGDDDV